MYKIDIENKRLKKLILTNYGEHNLMERSDIEEWIEEIPNIIGEELLVIGKELKLPSGDKIDLLAIDKKGKLVIIELKREDPGLNSQWKSIKNASYLSNLLQEDIFKYHSEYLKSDEEESVAVIEGFINGEVGRLNEEQRIVMISKEFSSNVVTEVLRFRDSGIDIECVKLKIYYDEDTFSLFINSDIIIPLPEANAVF